MGVVQGWPDAASLDLSALLGSIQGRHGQRNIGPAR